MSLVPNDMTPILRSTLTRGAGAVRWQRPKWVAPLPPCNAACPAGEDIQAWLALAWAGDFEGAWRRLVQDNPLPATHGRAYHHLCERACCKEPGAAAQRRPRNGFTIGLDDDVCHTSRAFDRGYDIEDVETTRALLYGLGSDGTVGANKASVQLLAEAPITTRRVTSYMIRTSRARRMPPEDIPRLTAAQREQIDSLRRQEHQRSLRSASNSEPGALSFARYGSPRLRASRRF